jgi:hypothetical protein
MMFLEALLLLSPLVLVAFIVFRADRGSDPGNVFQPSREPEDEAARIRRQGGDAGGSFWPGGDGGSDGGGGGGGGGD